MIIPFSEDQIEDCVSQFVRDSEVHELADEGPTWSTGDYMDKPKSTPFEIPMERKAFLPLEILEKIASYASGYVCCVLGLGLSSPQIRQCMFLSGGPGRVLSEVLTRGGDPRALFTIRDHVPPEIAIAKAVETGDKMLDTIIAIWGTNVSDGGLQLAMKTGMSYGIDVVTSTVVGTVRHRNAYYVSDGRYDDVDGTIDGPYDEVFVVPDRTRLQGILDQCSPDAYPAVLARCVTTQEFLGVFATWDKATQRTCGNLIGTRKLPGDVVVEISSMGLGSSLGLLAEGLTKEQIMRTRHWPGVELRNLFTHGFTREVPMYLIKATIGTIVKEGMEEDLLGYLERNPFTFDADDVPEFINSLGYEKVLTGRWYRVFSRSLSAKSYSIACQLANVEDGIRIIRMSYSITFDDISACHTIPCALAMELVNRFGESSIRRVSTLELTTVEEAIWLCERHYKVVREDLDPPYVYNGVLYIPHRIDTTTRNITLDKWLSIMDMSLCVLSYPGF